MAVEFEFESANFKQYGHDPDGCGVIVCIHSDPHIGGLGPNQTKRLRGKLYLIPNDVDDLLRRYRRDFR